CSTSRHGTSGFELIQRVGHTISAVGKVKVTSTLKKAIKIIAS
ncbi:hypothetical protein Tco_1518287, partial [Tanacetum coccineum]